MRYGTVLFFWFLGGITVLGSEYKAEEARKKAEILSQRIICKQPEFYLGWPSIVNSDSGELIVTFSGDREEHVCPWGKIQLIRSRDGGVTWTAPETILSTPLDDRDPGMWKLRDGTLVLSWLTSRNFIGHRFHVRWPRHIGKLTPEIREKWTGYHLVRSNDCGVNWSAPSSIPAFAPHGGIQLEDSRLLYVGVHHLFDEGGKATCLSNLVLESKDGGKSWEQISTIPPAPGELQNHYHEPHVVETSAGKLIALFRYQPEDRTKCYMRQSESCDSGRTWTVPHATPLRGYPPHLLKLKSGELLVTYGVRWEPHGEYACLSYDKGKTWDIQNEILLQKGHNYDLGYPVSAELDDGSIVTVYYQQEKPGEKTCLMATHWRLR